MNRKRKCSKIPAVPVDTNNPNPVTKNAMESESKEEEQTDEQMKTWNSYVIPKKKDDDANLCENLVF